MDQVQYSQQQLFELGKLNYEKLALHCQTLEVAGLWEQARQVLRQTSTEALDTYVQAMLMKLAIHCGYALDCQMEFIQSIPVGNPLNIQTEMCVDQAWMRELEKIYKFPPILIQLCSLYDQQKGDDITEYFIDALLNILLCMAYLNGGKDDKIDGFIRQYYEKISYYVMGKTPEEHSGYLGNKLASDVIGCHVAKKEPQREQVARFQPGTAVAEPEKPGIRRTVGGRGTSQRAGVPETGKTREGSASRRTDAPEAEGIREESISLRADASRTRGVREESVSSRIDAPKTGEIREEGAGQRRNAPREGKPGKESINQRTDAPETEGIIREESVSSRIDASKTGEIQEESAGQRRNAPREEKPGKESINQRTDAPETEGIREEGISSRADASRTREIREERVSQRTDASRLRGIREESVSSRIDAPKTGEIREEGVSPRINAPEMMGAGEESTGQRVDAPEAVGTGKVSTSEGTDIPEAVRTGKESASQGTDAPEAEKIDEGKNQKTAAGHVKVRTRGSRSIDRNIEKRLAEQGKAEPTEDVEQGRTEKPRQSRAKAPKPGEQKDDGWIKAEKAESEELPLIPKKTKEEEELEQAELARQEFQRVKQRIQAREQAEVRAHEEKVKELVADLNALVGLNSVKEEIQSLINLIKIRKLRKQMNLPEMDMTYHMVFTGSPGTGKTTVARLVAKIYKELGVLTDGKLVETDRSGLVAGYVGQTAMKVHEIVEQSIGGVLFIDEAYSLVNPDVPNDFGGEAIDTLVKLMEDHRDNLVVIVAGYTKEMQNFLKSNTGLISRFNKFIDFPDYSNDELVSILDMMAKNAGLEIDEGAKAKVYQLLKGKSTEDMAEFGNARGIRNLFEKFVMNQADRLVMIENPTEADLRCITEEDVVV